jgi:hypothetical protein
MQKILDSGQLDSDEINVVQDLLRSDSCLMHHRSNYESQYNGALSRQQAAPPPPPPPPPPPQSPQQQQQQPPQQQKQQQQQQPPQQQQPRQQQQPSNYSQPPLSQSKRFDKSKAVQRMMSAATGSSNAIPGISHVYKIPVPPINAAANLPFFDWGGATKYMSGCERGYADVGGLKCHLHGVKPHCRSCTDPRCVSQATEYPLLRRRAKAVA